MKEEIHNVARVIKIKYKMNSINHLLKDIEIAFTLVKKFQDQINLLKILHTLVLCGILGKHYTMDNFKKEEKMDMELKSILNNKIMNLFGEVHFAMVKKLDFSK